MSESKHTEGKWSLKNLDSIGLITELVAEKERIVSDGRGKPIGIGPVTSLAHIYPLQDGLDNEARVKEHKANARLIAAAPELLELCEQTFEWSQTDQCMGGDFPTFAESIVPKLETLLNKVKG